MKSSLGFVQLMDKPEPEALLREPPRDLQQREGQRDLLSASSSRVIKVVDGALVASMPTSLPARRTSGRGVGSVVQSSIAKEIAL